MRGLRLWQHAPMRWLALLLSLLALPAVAQEEAPQGPNRLAALKDLPPLPPPPSRFELPGGFVLTPMAHVQLWGTILDLDDAEGNDPVVRGDPDHREGFSLRRARFGVGLEWRRVLGVSVLAGWNDRYDALQSRPANADLVEALILVRPFDFFGGQAGLTRVAFGRQIQTSSNLLSLHERAMLSEAIAPGREPGLMLSGSLGPKQGFLPPDALSYQVSITNGEADFTGDLDPAPRIAGRLQLDLGDSWDSSEVNFALPSFAASAGGGASQHWGLEADEFTAGADLGVRVWRFTVIGEFAYQRATPTFDVEGVPEVLARRDALGVYGHLGVQVVPQWLEVAVRVDWLDDHTGLQDAGDRLDVMGGVGLWIFQRRLKLQLDYVHRAELTPSAVTPNDSLVMLIQARL